MTNENLYKLWAKKNPQWEARHEDLFRVYTEYGLGSTKLGNEKGKILGAAYELFIVAFFIGLYNDRRRKLNPDVSKQKKFGWPIENWGNFESRGGKRNYHELMKYIFAALIARTEIDIVELDKGKVTENELVSKLMDTMEEYANWGLHYIEDIRDDNPTAFFNEDGFLSIFIDMIGASQSDEYDDEEIEEF